jgi:hypothetical protein
MYQLLAYTHGIIYKLNNMLSFEKEVLSQNIYIRGRSTHGGSAAALPRFVLLPVM